MSYIKIYPKSLNLLRVEPNAYTGKVLFDIEQYGQLYPNQFFEVRVARFNITGTHESEWSILSVQDHPDIKNFDSFLRALNFFVFNSLKIQIPGTTDPYAPPYFDVELREVYFALDPDTPTAAPDYSWEDVG